MNRTHLASLICLAFLILTLGTAALAQDVLPLPASGENAAAKAATIQIFTPVLSGEISAMDPVRWSSVNAAKYTITFKIMTTGQIVRWQPQFMCNAVCMNYEYPMPLFNAARDGDIVQVRVTAKVDGVKHKSQPVLAYVNEVEQANPMFPLNQSTVNRNELSYFTWHMSDIAVKYTLFVKDIATGKTALKYTIDIDTHCNTMLGRCMANFLDIGNPAKFLKQSTAYKWYVVTKGVSGEKAKSQVFKLTTSADKG